MHMMERIPPYSIEALMRAIVNWSSKNTISHSHYVKEYYFSYNLREKSGYLKPDQRNAIQDVTKSSFAVSRVKTGRFKLSKGVSHCLPISKNVELCEVLNTFQVHFE